MEDSEGKGCAYLVFALIILIIISNFSVIWPYLLLTAIVGVLIYIIKMKIVCLRHQSDSKRPKLDSSKPLQNPLQSTKAEHIDHLTLCRQGKHYIDAHCKCKVCGKEQHKFIRCYCIQCGERRHSWNGCKCLTCGSLRDIGHIWDGCKCSICGSHRDTNHIWDGCKCTICGVVRNQNHPFDFNGVCKKCGLYNPDKKAQPNKYCTGLCSECRREVCLEDIRK